MRSHIDCLLVIIFLVVKLLGLVSHLLLALFSIFLGFSDGFRFNPIIPVDVPKLSHLLYNGIIHDSLKGDAHDTETA